MPQLILEYSGNIIEKNNLPNLLLKCHQVLTDNLPTEIAGCKSRAVQRDTFCVGDGSPNHAFVHVNLQVLPGRSLEVLQKVGNHLMQALKDYFAESLKKFKLQLTIEISELPKTYFKYAV